MLEPRRLTTLWASMVCYWYSFTVYTASAYRIIIAAVLANVLPVLLSVLTGNRSCRHKVSTWSLRNQVLNVICPKTYDQPEVAVLVLLKTIVCVIYLI
jgi:hypothetical protein